MDEPIYKGQAGMQNLLLAITGLSLPILLCAKAYFLSKEMAIHHHLAHDDVDKHEEHGFGEILIHQATDTI